MRDINSLNRVILLGRLGQKPEIRVLPQQDRSVARFSLATNERIFNRSTNETSDRTEWHKIVVWGKLAEFCEKYMDKGKQVLVEGRLRTRSWQDRDGNKRTTTEIDAQSIVLLGGGRREGAAEAGPVPVADTAVTDFPAEEETPASGEGDDEVPF
jgi:single-strand DNA-binding protein